MSGMQSAQLFHYGLKLPTPNPALPHLHASAMAATSAAGNCISPSSMDLQRAQQLYDYNARLQYTNAMRAYSGPHGMPYPIHPHEALAHAFFAKQLDPRATYLHAEPKPAQSYIGLISMAILSHKDHKLVLADIYQWIMDSFGYFRNRGPGWRNSIRHNLSLNDCFIKSGRSANGKGHYWAIHPANKEDFKRGDFRRRRAQRKVRKAMGLAVPDDEDDSPSPPPATTTMPDWSAKVLSESPSHTEGELSSSQLTPPHPGHSATIITHPCVPRMNGGSLPTTRKRLFDVESLLAPDITVREDDWAPPEKQARVSMISNLNEHSHSDDDEDAVLDVCETDDEGSNSVTHRHGLIIIEPTCPDEDKKRKEMSHTDYARDDYNSSFPYLHRPISMPTCSSVSSADDGSPRPVTPASAKSPISSPSSSPPTETRGSLSYSPLLSVPSWHQHAAFVNGNKLGFSPATNPAMAAALLAASNNPSARHQHGLWSALPSSVYPLLSTPFPIPAGIGSQAISPAEQAQAAQRWHETVSRIMARSCEKNVKLEA